MNYKLECLNGLKQSYVFFQVEVFVEVFDVGLGLDGVVVLAALAAHDIVLQVNDQREVAHAAVVVSVLVERLEVAARDARLVQEFARAELL